MREVWQFGKWIMNEIILYAKVFNDLMQNVAHKSAVIRPGTFG